MSTSLGFRQGHEHNAERHHHTPTRTVLEPINTEMDMPVRQLCRSIGLMVPHGFVMLLLYSALFVTVPLLWFYVEYDYSRDDVRIGTIVMSSLVALALILSNSYVAWFNMALFAHIGFEVKLLERTLDYAMAEGTSEEGMVLAYVAFVTIIVHLVPFLFIDRASLLILLAFVGVVVNTATAVCIEPSLLMYIGLSSTGLLYAAICISARCAVSTSLLTSLRESMSHGACLMCVAYEA